MSHSHDVLVVGGGMVGAAFALGLAQARPELRIGLIELREPGEPDLSQYDLRVSALTRASQRTLSSLGVWDGMVERRVTPYTHMHVWDATGPGSIEFAADDLGEPNLGHIVENGVITAALWDRLRHTDNIERLCPQKVAALTLDGGASVTTASGEVYSADLLVAADGARSQIREMANIPVSGAGYGQKAVVCVVKPAAGNQATAWQRFLPEGPLAFLPLDPDCSSIVWSVSEARADALVAADEADFLRQLEADFEGRLGALELVSARGAFPLRHQHAQAYVQPHLALIGDAAHAIHPLAGQGVNLGLLDAATLEQSLIEGLERGRPAGDIVALRRYERRRRGDNALMMNAMTGFKELFGSDLAPLRWARNAGLGLTNAAKPIKSAIMRRAMGLDGELPTRAQG